MFFRGSHCFRYSKVVFCRVRTEPYPGYLKRGIWPSGAFSTARHLEAFRPWGLFYPVQKPPKPSPWGLPPLRHNVQPRLRLLTPHCNVQSVFSLSCHNVQSFLRHVCLSRIATFNAIFPWALSQSPKLFPVRPVYPAMQRSKLFLLELSLLPCMATFTKLLSSHFSHTARFVGDARWVAFAPYWRSISIIYIIESENTSNRSNTTHQACARSYRLYGSHPETGARIHSWVKEYTCPERLYHKVRVDGLSNDDSVLDLQNDVLRGVSSY